MHIYYVLALIVWLVLANITRKYLTAYLSLLYPPISSSKYGPTSSFVCKKTKLLIGSHPAFAVPKFSFQIFTQQLLRQSSNTSEQLLRGHADARCTNVLDFLRGSLTLTCFVGAMEFACNLAALLPGRADQCKRGFKHHINQMTQFTIFPLVNSQQILRFITSGNECSM